MSIRDIKIPKLPYGEGSISIFSDELLIYKKNITVSGNKKRVSVYGKTVKEVMINMKAEEKKCNEKQVKEIKSLLYESMSDWLKTTKAPELKPKSYDRLECTLKNQIIGSSIGTTRYQSVTSNEVSAYMQELVNKKYSWSTIKKVYDLLNDFYRDKMITKEITDNPMLIVKMTSKENVLKPVKEIEFFNNNDILKFTEEASKTQSRHNKLKYPLGYIFIAWIYLGLRVGELIALRVKDVDMDTRTIIINKSVERIINRVYDENNKDIMKKNGITRYVNQEGSTKTKATRIVYMNNKAYEAMMMYFKYNPNKKSDDYLIATNTGSVNTDQNVSSQLKVIEQNAKIKIQSGATHVLRHTCASLYFRQNVQIEIIASILGNSVDVCRNTYIHFIEEQQRQATHSIARIDIE